MGAVDLAMLRVLVSGGRDYTDGMRLTSTLAGIHASYGIEVVIHGACGGLATMRGADALAHEWAIHAGVPVRIFPVSECDWKTLGRRAEPARNARMIAEGQPDLAVVFPGGSGTRDAANKCRAAGVRVMEVA